MRLRLNTSLVSTRCVARTSKEYHSGTISRSILINADAQRVWERTSKIADLGAWVSGVHKTLLHSSVRRGVGAVRSIEFASGDIVRERITGWKASRYFSYIMIDGLPLRTYHATISVAVQRRDAARVTWRSYFGSKRTTKAEFGTVVCSLGTLYSSSLENLKRLIESRT